jgi:hypothetical protein
MLNSLQMLHEIHLKIWYMSNKIVAMEIPTTSNNPKISSHCFHECKVVENIHHVFSICFQDVYIF